MESRVEVYVSLSQQIRLTPSLVLGLELLQLPILDLEELLKREVEENPLIEVIDAVYSSSSTYYEPVEDEGSSPVPSPVSVRDKLLTQVNLEFEGLDREIAHFIVNNLDRRGLLSVTPHEVAGRFEVTLSKVEEIREKIRSFNPAGCGSLNVIELIQSQLRELGAPLKLIALVGKFNSVEELVTEGKVIEELKPYAHHLDLFPFYDGYPPIRVKPDVKVWLEEDDVKVEVLTPDQFDFKVNNYYLKHAQGEELRRYILEKYQRALYLKRALDNRRETLLRLTKALFENQKEFLRDGRTLKPFTISELSSCLSLHESTVSRAVKDKYVETPFGLFPLRFFFKKGFSGKSVDEIKSLIKEIIEKEDKSKPLSDSKIASLLCERGIKIARRTVAKYREEMGIPGAYRRRS